MTPSISKHYQEREPSSIRKAQILFNARKNSKNIHVVNLAIGNISLPMHPVMINRMKSLGSNKKSIFNKGIVEYSISTGTKDCQDAIIHSINAELDNQISNEIKAIITDGGSQAMELMLLGVCGPSSEKPILLIDPTYTNYIEFSKRLSIPISRYSRHLKDDGSYRKINTDNILNIIDKDNPAGILLIPGDNPTGQQITQDKIMEIAKLCVEKDIWLISDEAYRNIYFTSEGATSIWAITNEMVPGIKGRRISIESASKLWNACGLRIGALVTDNKELHKKAVSEYTANLCANVIGQYIYSSILELSNNELKKWFKKQRNYYYTLINNLKKELILAIPGIIVSNPESAIYLVIDFKNITDDNFEITKFIEYCATSGKCLIDNKIYTLLLAPMTGFYSDNNSGRTQARVAIVESEENLNKVPKILSKLIEDYSHYDEAN